MTKEKKDEIEKLDKTVDRQKLLYRCKGNTSDVDFSGYFSTNDLINKIKDGTLV